MNKNVPTFPGLLHEEKPFCFTPTREAGLKQVKTFTPQTGRRHSALRNYDFGPSLCSGDAHARRPRYFGSDTWLRAPPAADKGPGYGPPASHSFSELQKGLDAWSELQGEVAPPQGITVTPQRDLSRYFFGNLSKTLLSRNMPKSN